MLPLINSRYTGQVSDEAQTASGREKEIRTQVRSTGRRHPSSPGQPKSVSPKSVSRISKKTSTMVE